MIAFESFHQIELSSEQSAAKHENESSSSH